MRNVSIWGLAGGRWDTRERGNDGREGEGLTTKSAKDAKKGTGAQRREGAPGRVN